MERLKALQEVFRSDSLIPFSVREQQSFVYLTFVSHGICYSWCRGGRMSSRTPDIPGNARSVLDTCRSIY